MSHYRDPQQDAERAGHGAVREQRERASTGMLGVGGPCDRSIPHAAFATTFLHSCTRAPWLKKQISRDPVEPVRLFYYTWSGPLHCAQPPYGGGRIASKQQRVRFFYVPALLDKRCRTDPLRVLSTMYYCRLKYYSGHAAFSANIIDICVLLPCDAVLKTTNDCIFFLCVFDLLLVLVKSRLR